MEDATYKMNEMTAQLNSAQIKSIEYKGRPTEIEIILSQLWSRTERTYFFPERVSDLERENAALVTQVEEVTAQQLDRDKAIDEFSIEIDSRINEWKVYRSDTVVNNLKSV